MLNDILRACANPHVAEGAVASIGGDVATRVKLFAGAAGLSVGAYAAREVARFRADAESADMDALVAAIAGCDMPVLKGLRFVLAHAFDGDRDARGGRADARPRC